MRNVVTLASQTPALSTLVKLLQAADLVDTVQNLYNATVFAPTNEAFAEFPEDILEELLLPSNKEKLRKVLLTHVVGQEIFARDIYSGEEVRAASGELLEF